MDKIRAARDAAGEAVQKYQIGFILNADRISSFSWTSFPLHWSSIRFANADEISRIPDDKRGIYAFVVAADTLTLPTHGYIMYVGIAGRRSTRSLRARYGDYLDTTKVLRRPKVMRMVSDWHDVLRFFFAPVDSTITSEQLEALEQCLNATWMPPYSPQDMDATTRSMRRAFE